MLLRDNVDHAETDVFDEFDHAETDLFDEFDGCFEYADECTTFWAFRLCPSKKKNCVSYQLP